VARYAELGEDDAKAVNPGGPPDSTPEWTEVLGSERLNGALLDRLTHNVQSLEMNGRATG